MSLAGCVRAVWLNQVLARSSAGGGGGSDDDDDDDDAAAPEASSQQPAAPPPRGHPCRCCLWLLCSPILSRLVAPGARYLVGGTPVTSDQILRQAKSQLHEIRHDWIVAPPKGVHLSLCLLVSSVHGWL
ncbi:hypothetical protein GY632_5324 [Trichophyton interdigitale]|nr:hypothetical protein GY632_5324 [Trichophyton interdigitale]